MDRITDLLIGLVLGFYLPKTITIFGAANVHWTLYALGIFLFLQCSKKFGRFLLDKLSEKVAKKVAKNVKKELKKELRKELKKELLKELKMTV